MLKPCNSLFAQISSAPTLHYAAPVVPAGFLDRFAVLQSEKFSKSWKTEK